MDLLDERFHLDMMPIAPEGSRYLARLRSVASQSGRVTLRPPVATSELATSTNGYDLGIHLLPPYSENARLALPNKLFEYVQARLGVAIWPSPEMRKVVEQYGLGVVADEFTLAGMAQKLNALTAADLRRFKQNSHTAAPELCAERNRDTFLDIVDRVLHAPAVEPCAS